MTTTTYSSETTRTGTAAIGVGSAAVASGFCVLGAHDWGEIFVIVGAVVVAAALVFGLVVPRSLRKESSGKAALWCSIPALVLAVPAFWSGVPLVLGAAGMVLGNVGRNAPQHSGKAIAALVVGTLAVLGYLGIYIGDTIVAGHHGFLFD